MLQHYQPAENLGEGGNEEGNYECIEEATGRGRAGWECACEHPTGFVWVDTLGKEGK